MAVAGPISMGPALGLSSAAGLISMLEETEVQLQTTALRSLNKVIDTHWAEVAGSISVIEAMYEDEFFAQRELAALLALQGASLSLPRVASSAPRPWRS